jgi:hypothetical protein
MSRYTVTLKPGARDQLKTLDLQVRAALAEAILDLQFELPSNAEADEVDPQRYSLYLPPAANGLRPFLVYRVTPLPRPSTNGLRGEVSVLTVAQYATPAPIFTPITPVSPTSQPSKYMVYDILVKNLSIEEIDQLIFELGRDVPDLEEDNLPRDTKEELARELVQYLARRSALDKLVVVLRARRPDIQL